MNSAWATTEALHQLATGQLQTVCLVKPRCFAVLVTFDHRTGDFVFATPWLLNRRRRRHIGQPVSIAEILFQTEPHPFPALPAS